MDEWLLRGKRIAGRAGSSVSWRQRVSGPPRDCRATTCLASHYSTLKLPVGSVLKEFTKRWADCDTLGDPRLPDRLYRCEGLPIPQLDGMPRRCWEAARVDAACAGRSTPGTVPNPYAVSVRMSGVGRLTGPTAVNALSAHVACAHAVRWKMSCMSSWSVPPMRDCDPSTKLGWASEVVTGAPL